MNKISSKIYANIPIVFQNAMITVYGYYWKNRRLGKVFNNNLKKFKLRESFTDIQWLE